MNYFHHLFKIDLFFLNQAYAAGCDIAILASDFQRVQVIPGVTHGNIKVSCVDCSTDTGKVKKPILLSDSRDFSFVLIGIQDQRKY